MRGEEKDKNVLSSYVVPIQVLVYKLKFRITSLYNIGTSIELLSSVKINITITYLTYQNSTT
jgi:hypothetical protein